MADKEGLKVGITGSYGGLNLGDEAILQSIIAQLRRDLPQVADKPDPEAQQLDKPTNPHAVLGAIENQDREEC